MKTANYYHLHQIIGALNTLSDELCTQYITLNKDDEDSIKNILCNIVKPQFLALSDESQKKCKDSLQYFLTTEMAPFDDIISAQQESPLETPSEPINFFIWLWEVLYPGENFRLDSLDGWVVDNDICKSVLMRQGY